MIVFLTPDAGSEKLPSEHVSVHSSSIPHRQSTLCTESAQLALVRVTMLPEQAQNWLKADLPRISCFIYTFVCSGAVAIQGGTTQTLLTETCPHPDTGVPETVPDTIVECADVMPVVPSKCKNEHPGERIHHSQIEAVT